jgi:hypothetical protein
MSQQLVVSMPERLNLEIFRGNSGALQVQVQDSTGAPADVSTATFTCDVHAGAYDATKLAAFLVSPTAGDPSSVDVSITPDQTGLLDGYRPWYELTMNMGGGVVTLLSGRVLLRDAVRVETAVLQAA